MRIERILSSASWFARVILVIAGSLVLSALGAFCSTLPVSAAPYISTRPASGGELNFVQSATSTNVSGDSTIIDQTLLNNNQHALLFVTADWNPHETYTGFDSAHVGVRYDAAIGRWAIFNEDRSAMPVGAQFAVLAWTTSVSSDGFFVQRARGSRRPYLFIDNPLSNNNPNVHLFITPIWNPDGNSHGVYDTHAAGVWYDSQVGKWQIYHEDGLTIPPGAAYNVYIDASPTFPVTVTTNINGLACIDESSLNGNSDATPIITHDFTSLGLTDVVGVWYNPNVAMWCVFDNTGKHLPADAQFFVEPLT